MGIRLLFILLIIAGAWTTAPSPQNNAIATAHPLATQAGEAIFSKGGTAADAAVAAAFTLSVVEPSMSGLGGAVTSDLYH